MKNTISTILTLFLCSTAALGQGDPPCQGCKGDLQVVSQKAVPGYKIKVEFHDPHDPEYKPDGSCKLTVAEGCKTDEPCAWKIRYTYTVGPGKTADLRFCRQELSPEEGDETCWDVHTGMGPGQYVTDELAGGGECGSIRKDTIKLGPSETVYYLICTSCVGTGGF